MKSGAQAAFAWLALQAPAADAIAASFGCNRLTTSVERMICVDPKLSAMDRALGRRFDETLTLSLDPAALRADEQLWLAASRDSATTREDLAKVYTARLAALEQSGAQLRAKDAKRIVDAAQVKDRCLPALADPDATCRVAEFAEIGTVDGHAFAYARYRYAPKEIGFPDYTRIVVYEHREPGGFSAVVSPDANPARTYQKPQILRADGRVLLHIPGVESGTGLANSERLFVWRGDHWRDVDVTSWLEVLARRAPAGFSAIKGIYPDYVTLKASTPLWLDSDDIDCPSGKRADLTLAWRGDRIALDGMRLEMTGECGKPLPPGSGAN
jgi:hypothetical protein